jgi:metal-dependent hydrolase (beta-lactamase superfamily II)
MTDRKRMLARNELSRREFLRVEYVEPSHSTGEEAIAAFSDEYGEDFVLSGAGSIIGVQ